MYNIIKNNINNINNILMNIHKEKVIKLLKERKVITTSELAKDIDVSWNTAEKILLELTIENKLERIKKEGVNLWLAK